MNSDLRPQTMSAVRGAKKKKSRLKCGFGRETQFMEDEDEVRMPLCACAVYRVGRTFLSLEYSWDRW